MTVDRVVIVGAGQAGFEVAASLRHGKYPGAITILGNESHAPYQRPPLSKAYLNGAVAEAELMLRGAGYYGDHGITVESDARVESIDRKAATIRTANGGTVPYDHLVLATGARNRALQVPGSDLEGVLALRGIADAQALRERLRDTRRLVVVGAGFIGLEVAAVAAARGIEVSVVELSHRVMGRVVSIEMAEYFVDAHVRQQVAFHFRDKPVRIVGKGGAVTGVELESGKELAADCVLVAIGVTPDIELATDAGLPTDNGILVDASLRTADPAISAIGDCARFPDRYGDPLLRLESVQNAVDQGRHVAARILSDAPTAPYHAVPWFWSDQGKMRLQIAGVTAGSDEHVPCGSRETGSFSVVCFRHGELIGVESVNRAGDHMAARRLLRDGPRLTPEQAAADGFDLKSWVKGTIK